MALVLLQRVTLTGSAASVTLSNIPQNYKTLRLQISVRSDYAGGYADDIIVRANSATNGYSYRSIWGTGTTQGSSNGSTTSGVYLVSVATAATATAATFGSIELLIPNYSSSAYKTFQSDGVSENNAANAIQGLAANLWANASAITTLSIHSLNSANFVSGSTFSLYATK